jgi:large subunit ribosomal protein L23
MRHGDQIIKRLYVTEKGTTSAEKENKYAFEVASKANKVEIKQAVEKLFKVTAVKVNTMQCGGKKKRLKTMKYGKRPDWKKAVVTLKKGDKIEVA